MCWYCYWGLPKPVAEIYKKALEALDGDSNPLEFGPSHIVWSDYNMQDGNIKFCIDECDNNRKAYHQSDKDIAVVRQSLVELLQVPEEVRNCEPFDDTTDLTDYENHPENYPPPQGIEMVKI